MPANALPYTKHVTHGGGEHFLKMSAAYLLWFWWKRVADFNGILCKYNISKREEHPNRSAKDIFATFSNTLCVWNYLMLSWCY